MKPIFLIILICGMMSMTSMVWAETGQKNDEQKMVQGQVDELLEEPDYGIENPFDYDEDAFFLGDVYGDMESDESRSY